MNSVEVYTVDAFTNVLFRGNTCAVCILPSWPDDALLQNIAIQNQFAETAFIVPRQNENPELRWFTTSKEVDFCGYGTISAGYVFLRYLNSGMNTVTFSTRRYGAIPVFEDGGFYRIEVPVKLPQEDIFNGEVLSALGGEQPERMIASERGDLLIVYKTEDQVRSITPDFQRLVSNGFYGYVLTSPASNADYAFRYFSPRMVNVWEDPVNGASQSVLTPYWAKRLNKENLHGVAVSVRGGDVYCSYTGGHKVCIGGQVVTYAHGRIFLPSWA